MLFEEAKLTGNQGESTIGGPQDAGPHMTTADVAQDMISILDVYAATDAGKDLSEASLLNYWGFSYGSVLGETFASMFPDRIGRVVLEGGVDPEDWTSGLILKNILFLDGVWDTFYTYCHAAGPVACPVYTGNSPLDIYNRFEKSFLKLNASHAAAQNWENATLIEMTLSTVKEAMAAAAYSPITLFPSVSTLQLDLEELLTNFTVANVMSWEDEVVQTFVNPPSNKTVIDMPSPDDNSATSIFSTDSGGVSYNLTLQDLTPWIQQVENQSAIAGAI